MKASVSFRENRSPIFRAKIPLNIFGLPFRSSVEATNSDELCLSFMSMFNSGPIIKFLYRPNDSINPFGFAFKTGIELFGSPINSPMTMTTDISVLGNHRPSFFFNFRPQAGDFAVKRSIKPEKMNIPFSVPRIIDGLISDMNVTATTKIPVRTQATVKLRWNVIFPADVKSSSSRRNGYDTTPYLALNKIGIELGEVKDEVKKKIDDMQAEMASLRKNFDELRSEMMNSKASSMAATEISRRNEKENRG